MSLKGAPTKGGFGINFTTSETKSCAKLELPRESPIFNGGNFPGVTGHTIDALVALGGVEAQDRVIEDVETFHTELKIHPLRKLEILEQREVRGKGVRPVEGITSHIAELAHSGRAERRVGLRTV